VTSVTARAPGKVNLVLSVGGPRPDGYHDVATVYQAVSLYDEVTVSPGDGDLTVAVTGEAAHDVPLDADNLAIRAALLLAEHARVRPVAHLHITKGIPVGGGMAGGSADAAAALVACDAFWGTDLDRTTLLALAAELGSDVPFPLMGGTAVGVGRGERLTPALARGRFTWTLALAEGGLSTPAVYAEIDRLRAVRVLPEPHVGDLVMAALRAGDAVELGRSLSNDLQPASLALRPALVRTLDIGAAHGALGAMVSGSGPTCAFLAADDEHSRAIADALLAAGACSTARVVHGPVHGARVVSEQLSQGGR
jgi:4-diphosphocytidyl-2-C-methyl-D-erythritol kinase